MNGHEISALTGIRAVVAYWVVCYHLLPVEQAPAPIFTLVSRGATGVDIFFILSGFILTYTYQGRDFADRTFWLLRAARIYPVYLVGMVLFTPFIVMNLAEKHASLIDVSIRMLVYGITTLVLVQAWIPRLALAWNGPGWSLSAEAFFYALFPYLLRLLKSKTLFFTAGVAAIAYLCYLLPITVNIILPERISDDQQWILFKTFNPIVRLPEFIIGICLGRLTLSGYGRIIAKLTFPILFVFILTSSIINNSFIFHIVSIPIICLLIISLFYGNNKTCRAFASWPMVMLGHASYAVYILHIPIAYWYNWLNVGDPKAIFSIPDLVIYLIILTCLALLSYRFIERPANNALRRMIAELADGRLMRTLRRRPG